MSFIKNENGNQNSPYFDKMFFSISLKQSLTGRKRGEDGNTKIWLSRAIILLKNSGHKL